MRRIGPSPSTARVAPGTRGFNAAIMALSASNVRGSLAPPWGMSLARAVFSAYLGAETLTAPRLFGLEGRIKREICGRSGGRPIVSTIGY
jgi:hypothetical protein